MQYKYSNPKQTLKYISKPWNLWNEHGKEWNYFQNYSPIAQKKDLFTQNVFLKLMTQSKINVKKSSQPLKNAWVNRQRGMELGFSKLIA